LLLVAFLLVNALNCHLSLVLVSVVQRDAVNCNRKASPEEEFSIQRLSFNATCEMFS